MFQLRQQDPVIHCIKCLLDVYKDPKMTFFFLHASLTLSTMSMTTIAVECPDLKPYWPGAL
jgi:hypothetical protein